MSLFGFVKDIGRSVFKRNEEAAGKIAEHLRSSKLNITGLSVDYDDGIVALGGECDSADTFEKAVLITGNVKGVIDVYTSELRIRPSAQAISFEPAPQANSPRQTVPVVAGAPAVEYYVIKSGDTLGKIARHYYGNANRYPRIFDANREVIEDPDKIYPGQKIRIPLG